MHVENLDCIQLPGETSKLH